MLTDANGYAKQLVLQSCKYYQTLTAKTIMLSLHPQAPTVSKCMAQNVGQT